MAEYDRDFYAWTLAQAEALRAKDWQTLDMEHLAEEIEALGKSDRRPPESPAPPPAPSAEGDTSAAAGLAPQSPQQPRAH
jgi:hypothetical protein